jgi:DNA primase
LKVFRRRYLKIEPATIASVKQLVDPETLLNHLGFLILRRTPKELRGPCKVHGGDNPTAFRFNTESKTWCCYTRHCEGEKNRDVVGLVELCTKQPFVESIKFLADLCGINLENQAELTEEFKKIKVQQEMLQEVRRNQTRVPVTSFFPEEIVEELLPRRSEYFIDRGFPEELLDFYEIGGTTDNRGIHRETIPIRDEDGNLLTISERRTDSDEDPKYILMKDIKKEATLYNLHIAKEYTGIDRSLILVEGFVDVWALSLLGIYNVVAMMGTYITPNQARLLWKYAENITVMLDADDAGREAAPKIAEMLYQGASIRVIDLPDGKDPKNLTYMDLVELGLGEITNVS